MFILFVKVVIFAVEVEVKKEYVVERVWQGDKSERWRRFSIMLKVTASGQRWQRNARFLAIQNEILLVSCALLAKFATCSFCNRETHAGRKPLLMPRQVAMPVVSG
jgi:hypothetical protein